MKQSEEACFVYNNEIYYRIDASDEEIDLDLQRMVEHSMWDDSEFSEKTIIQAHAYLIIRQNELILKKHCE